MRISDWSSDVCYSDLLPWSGRSATPAISPGPPQGFTPGCMRWIMSRGWTGSRSCRSPPMASALPSTTASPAPPEDAEKTMTAQTAVPTATPLSAAMLDRFKALVGPKGWSQDPDIIAPHLREPRDLYAGISPLLPRPANTEEVAAIVTQIGRAPV